jgi:hypothetical protein
MPGIELFIWLLLGFGWVVFQVIQRVLKRPRPLGTIEDETPSPSPVTTRTSAPVEERDATSSPWDVGWGRTAEPAQAGGPAPPDWGTAPVPVPVPVSTVPPAPPRRTRAEVSRARDAEPFMWSRDAAQSELRLARQLARRQADASPAPGSDGTRRHPLRPRLRTHRDLRQAVVLAAVIGPCRAMDEWKHPGSS